MIPSALNTPLTLPDSTRAPRDARIWQAAQEFETVFLAEMLRGAGVGEARASFGGGAGEDAFAGLLVNEQAALMVERGGIGLAERVYASLAGREKNT